MDQPNVTVHGPTDNKLHGPTHIVTFCVDQPIGAASMDQPIVAASMDQSIVTLCMDQPIVTFSMD